MTLTLLAAFQGAVQVAQAALFALCSTAFRDFLTLVFLVMAWVSWPSPASMQRLPWVTALRRRLKFQT